MGTRHRQAGADALIGTWQDLSEFQQIGLCGGCDNSNGKLSDDGHADRGRVHPEIKGRGKNMNELKELLEVRRAILREHIALDKGCYNDPFLSQHSRGRVAVEEKWLEETEKMLTMVEKLDK